MKYPALDVRHADPDVVLALVDDFAPTAVEDIDAGISVFFTTPERREQVACQQTALAARQRRMVGRDRVQHGAETRRLRQGEALGGEARDDAGHDDQGAGEKRAQVD